MCGIFGFNFHDKNLAKSMARVLNHRGPDHNDTYVNKRFTLGYTRLSIIDLKKGQQPIYNEEQNVVLFFNGEIYNFMELRKKLEEKGHKFYTDTDSEVIVHSYEEYGRECLNYFNGMFAFVLYDLKKKELFIARDRLGIKPLYYFYDNSKFIFASEIKAILEYSGIKRELNDNVLDVYFSFRYCPTKETMLRNIYKLQPGHFLVYNTKGLVTKKYWDLKFSSKNKSLDYYRKQFLSLFENSVKYRMISDVPVGALLSGGIDSSSIVAMMRKNTEEKIDTYTIGFEGERNNEFSDARLISDKFGTEHHEYTIDSSYVKKLPQIVWHLDEPLADPTAIPNYVLAENASRDVKVLINGDGADEIFGGYEQYRIMKAIKKVPNLVKKTGSFSLNLLPKEPFFLKTKDFLESDETGAFLNLSSVFTNDEKEMLLKNKSKNISYRIIRKNFSRQDGLMNKMLYNDIKTFLPDNMLMKYDKITMAKSIEGRVPFCDHNIAKFSSSLPEGYKIDGNTEKYILRQAMKRILPRQTIKKKKQRFMVPTTAWYKQDFGDYARNLLDEKEDTVNKFFKDKYIEKLLSTNKMISGKLLNFNKLTKLYYSRQLWTVTNFILWHDMFIRGEKPR